MPWEPAEPPRPMWRRWRTWVLVVAGLACVTVAILAAVASRYQPLGYGSTGGIGFPGIPSGNGIRPVNNLGGFHEDWYIPPQRGTFGLFADIRNNGTHPVTIVSVSMNTGWPLSLAGPVRYSTPGMGGSNQIPPPASRVLHDVVLPPGHEMFLGFPVHMWPCATSGWTGITDFTVTMRYLTFTHTVSIPWGIEGDSLIMRLPGGKPGQKGVTCAPGTTLANLPKVPTQNPGPQTVASTVIHVYKGADIGTLNLSQMTAADAATNVGAPLPPCFTQYPPHAARLPHYRVVNFDLNYTAMNLGGTAPNVRVTIAGPDGTPMIAAIPQGPAYTTISCQQVHSFLLNAGGTNSQEVLGLTLRVPLNVKLDHLLVTVGGHAMTIPISPAGPSFVNVQL